MSAVLKNPCDQADGLRQRGLNQPIQVIAVTAGKGGVGKTNVSVNLAIALSELDKRVLLLDADLSLANVDIMLGLTPKQNLESVLAGEASLEEVMIDGPNGISIIPASSGTKMMTSLSSSQRSGLINAFSDLSDNVDVLIIDTAAGISETVMTFSRAAQEVVVVVCDEPTSITDAYALIKVMSTEYGVKRFRILANMVADLTAGRELFAKLYTVTDRFLDVTLDFLGAVPFDESLRKAVKQQKAVLTAFPDSKASTEFTKVAGKVNAWPLSTEIGGHMTFFLERLVKSAQIA